MPGEKASGSGDGDRAPVAGVSEKVFTAAIINPPGLGAKDSVVKVHPGGLVEIGDSRHVFDRVFTAGSGTEAVASSDVLKDPRVNELFEQLDTNGNDSIEVKELRRFHRKVEGASHHEAADEAQVNTISMTHILFSLLCMFC